jgi:hypothetical protein
MDPIERLEAEEPEEGATVLLVCSGGSHLLRLQRLRAWWELYDRAWVSFRTMDAGAMLEGERVIWAPIEPRRRPVIDLLRNTRLAWRTIRSERPSLVVSTGAGLALPFFAVARLHGAMTVYVESHRVDRPSLAGRLCYPLSDLFVLQWEEQRRFYKKGELLGALI